MLTELSIKNFALIASLQVSFEKGLTTITGETGAGKSLLLGALGLLLGKRADLSAINDPSTKCVIEGTFKISAYTLSSFFEEKALDYEEETIIRREILPSGKSRAFINDTPVTLNLVSSLGTQLIDIHSQHQTLQVTTNDFQFSVLDAMSKATPELASYQRGLQALKTKKKALVECITAAAAAKKEHEYNLFLYSELEEAKLKPGEQQELEAIYETLHNVEDIRAGLSASLAIVSAEEHGAIDQLHTAKGLLQKIAGFSTAFGSLATRMESVYIELDDLQESMTKAYEEVEADPVHLEQVNQRLKTIHELQHKHVVNSVDALIAIHADLQQKVARTETLGQGIAHLQEEIEKIEVKLDGVAQRLHDKRVKALSKLTTALETMLHQLGMPNASFRTNLKATNEYLANGKDHLEFLFSANKGGNYGELKKVASGGELSRIMLGIKAILSQYVHLPTLIFDEIDTGVSGEIAERMADLMVTMSDNLQVFSITHLPQIAAKGHAQYKVYKEDVDDITVTQLRLLTPDDRVAEIAKMLGGTVVTATAVTHAKSLLHK